MGKRINSEVLPGSVPGQTMGPTSLGTFALNFVIQFYVGFAFSETDIIVIREIT